MSYRVCPGLGVGLPSFEPANNRLHTDAALRASADGRSGFAWFPSQPWFQADDRVARVKRTLGRQISRILVVQEK